VLRYLLLMNGWIGYVGTIDGVNEHSCVDEDPVCNSVTKHVAASDVTEDCDFIGCASISQSYWSVVSNLCEYFSHAF